MLICGSDASNASDCGDRNRVIVITEQSGNFGQFNFMEHKGVRYAIRIGIEKEQWRVAIYPSDDGLPEERTVSGPREGADIAARSMIDAWLRKRPTIKTKG
jgi:hypothetical protein